MKRTAKIAIHRQTLRILSPEAAQQIAGGGMTDNYKCYSDTVDSHGPTCGEASVCGSRIHCR